MNNSTLSGLPSSTEIVFGLENASYFGENDNNNNQSDFLLDYDYDQRFPLYMRIWATLASGIIFIIGVAGNILVPVLVWKNKQMRHSTNIFLLNLAMADGLILLVCLPTALVELHTIPNSWVLGASLCRIVPFIEITVSRASVFTLTVISVERYVAICKPLRANSLCTRPRAFGVCLGIWPVAFLAAGPVLVATEYAEPDPSSNPNMSHPICITSLQETWVSGFYLGSAGGFFLFPLFLLSSIYFLIGRKLLSHQTRNKKRFDNAQWKSRKQVVGMLVAVVIVFFVCLLPFQVVVVWLILAPEENISSIGPHVYYNLLFVCRILLYVNAAANPIIYNVMSAKFRSAVLRLFGKSQPAKVGLLRRHSTLTTSLSSSSSRSNSFRRIAHFALKRSFSDASIRRNATGPRLSSPAVFGASSQKYSDNPEPLVKAKEERHLCKWYLKKGTSGSYFGGDLSPSCSTLNEDSSFPLRSFHPSRLQSKKSAKYSPLVWELKNGSLQDRNRSLPELFSYPASSSPPMKRVSFKDNVLPRERPREISPLVFNPVRPPEAEETKESKKARKSKIHRRFRRCRKTFRNPFKKVQKNGAAISRSVGLQKKRSIEIIHNENEEVENEEVENDDVNSVVKLERNSGFKKTAYNSRESTVCNKEKNGKQGHKNLDQNIVKNTTFIKL